MITQASLSSYQFLRSNETSDCELRINFKRERKHMLAMRVRSTTTWLDFTWLDLTLGNRIARTSLLGAMCHDTVTVKNWYDRRLVVMGAAWQYTVSYTQPAVELGWGCQGDDGSWDGSGVQIRRLHDARPPSSRRFAALRSKQDFSI